MTGLTRDRIKDGVRGGKFFIRNTNKEWMSVADLRLAWKQL